MQPVETHPCSQHTAVEALARDRLKPPEREPVIRHLERCTVCRSEFRKLTAAWFPHLDTYTIVTRVASGGFGTVYRAVHHAKERTEALKVLHVRTPIHAAYFENEVHLIAQLRHPNIATLYEAQLATPPLYYTMEFVPGQRLNDYVRGHAVSLAERVRIVRTVAQAVGHAHAEGVVHRDLKPQNILIDADGQPHIVDFGIAKRLGLASLTPEATGSPDSEMDGPIGTLGYMAPEQIHGRAVDGRADVFALGALLFTTLTGEPARLARDPVEVERALRCLRARQPKDLAAIVARCVDDDPADRYASCAALVEDLDRYLDGRPVTARRDEAAGYRAARVAAWVLQRHPGAVRATILASVVAVLSVTMAAFAPHWFPPPTNSGDVILVAFDPPTFEALRDGAFREIERGADADNRKSWRLLHGRLLERVSRAQPSVVMWDYYFPDCQHEFDGPLLAAIRASPAPVILGADRFDEGGRPNLCPAYRDAIFACGVLHSTPPNELSREFDVPLCIVRGYEEPIPSLALAAFAATRAPEARPEFRIQGQTLHVRYRKAQTSSGGARWLALHDEIPLFNMQTPRDAGRYLHADDRLGHVRVRAASTDDWRARTVSFCDVLAADDAQLQRWFRNRAVVVGQMLPGVDEHALSESRSVFGCIVHAQTLESLLSSERSVPLTRLGLLLRILGWCGFAGLLAMFLPLPSGLPWKGLVAGGVVGAAGGLLLAVYVTAFVVERVWIETAIAACSLLTAGALFTLAGVMQQRRAALAPQNVVPAVESDTVPTTALVDAGSTATH